MRKSIAFLVLVVALGLVRLLVSAPFLEAGRAHSIATASSATREFIATQSLNAPSDGLAVRFYSRCKGARAWSEYFVASDAWYVAWGSLAVDEARKLVTLSAYGRPLAVFNWSTNRIEIEQGQRQFDSLGEVADPLGPARVPEPTAYRETPCVPPPQARGSR